MNFIKSLEIQNFFSIKNKVKIDFLSSEYTIKNHKDRAIEYNSNFYNKIIAIYGANSSGKTTILRAIVTIAHIISNELVTSFKNIYSDKEIESYISINYIINNQEFTYSVYFQSNKENKLNSINNEILLINNEELINREKKVFKDLNGKDLQILFDKISNKKSLLSETQTRTDDYNKMINFFDSLSDTTNLQSPYGFNMGDDILHKIMLAQSLFEIKEEDKNIKIKNSYKEDTKKFIINFLEKIGFDISDININYNKNDKMGLPFNLFTKHSIKNKMLDFDLESSGTKMLFKILSDIFKAYKENSILVIDELDTIIHPMLVPIINLLISENNIQIIYTTHNIYNMKYLYKDELFLIEKDKEHNTNIIPLKNNGKYEGYENFFTLYEKGELGALPEVTSLELNIDKILR